jgi:UDP-N-acetylbacillosamine N-acetyltransferase
MRDTMNVILFGTGELAKLLYYYMHRNGVHAVTAFSVHERFMTAESYLSLPVVPFETIEKRYSPRDYSMVMTLGYRCMRNRIACYLECREKGYRLVNFIGNQCVVPDNLSMGDNNIILDNVHLEPFVTIGSNNIFWSGSLVCHETAIGSHNFFAAKSVIGGRCTVGNNCFVGFNATIAQKIAVADETLVGAQSLLLEDTLAYHKYLGIPAKKTGFHKETGIVMST